MFNYVFKVRIDDDTIPMYQNVLCKVKAESYSDATSKLARQFAPLDITITAIVLVQEIVETEAEE